MELASFVYPLLYWWTPGSFQLQETRNTLVWAPSPMVWVIIVSPVSLILPSCPHHLSPTYSHRDSIKTEIASLFCSLSSRVTIKSSPHRHIHPSFTVSFLPSSLTTPAHHTHSPLATPAPGCLLPHHASHALTQGRLLSSAQSAPSIWMLLLL